MIFSKTPKFIRAVSDLHLDFDAAHALKTGSDELASLWKIPELPEDAETVLVLAGDLWTDDCLFTRRFGQASSWLEQTAAQFQAVVIVFGNHDYWDSTTERAFRKATTWLTSHGLNNVFILENSSVVFGNLKLLGGTLWTDYNRHNPSVMMAAQQIMNDHKKIRIGTKLPGRLSRPQDMYDLHVKTASFIAANSRRDAPEQRVVVVTHMAPTRLSIHERYNNSKDYMNNFCYFSDLDEMFFDEQFCADYWIHGHCHNVSDYIVDRTRVLCNPRGYYPFEQTGFNPALRINVSSLETE